MKDYPTFLKAAAMLAGKREDVRFICVGDGPATYKLEFRRLSRELGLGNKLIWAGNRQDMPAVYNAMDIASLSSSYGEGFPNVIGEAMACGAPCVVTDVGDLQWIVGNTGIVVYPRNPKLLSEAWQTMITRIGNHELQLREKVRQRIAEQFGVDTLIQRTEAVLRSLL
jgi:glycosyltransferase involved in cell wall biosynthesis